MNIGALLRAFGRSTVLIHTPKCAGTYILRNYEIYKNKEIAYVGHSTIRQIPNIKSKQIVGIIREPADWYASYYYFMKKSLAENAQSRKNFPPEHPITLFCGINGSLEEMINNMSDNKVLSEMVNKKIVANVYAKSIPDVFGFLKRTQSGFWTWTMMYHFSQRKTGDLGSKDDVIEEANNISRNVAFIHQEAIDRDVEKILKIPQKPNQPINVSYSSRNKDSYFNDSMKRKVRSMDGEVARILGGYEVY